MTILRMATHNLTGRRMVEILDDHGKLAGTIYPAEDGTNSIHIVSEHFEENPITEAPKGMIKLPGYRVSFRRRF